MSDMHDPYEDQLRASRYKAERDQARQELARLRGEATTVSAYDLLPQEDRDALRWVREHGGLDVLEAIWDNDVPLANGAISVLWTDARPDDCGNERVMDELSKRLMPEGMEWPRYDTGEPLKLDDEVAVKNCEPVTVRFISFDKNGFSVRHAGGCRVHWFTYGERVKRPAPKVLDADGAEIRVGDTVYEVKTGDKFVVETIYHGMTEPDSPEHTVRCHKPSDITAHMFAPDMLTHRAPFLAVDDKPLLKGETVWSVDSGTRYTVEEIKDGLIPIKCRSEMGSTVSLHPSQLTHERPESWERLEEDVAGASCPDVYCANHHIDASDTSYEWAMARDIVRRTRALAERGK